MVPHPVTAQHDERVAIGDALGSNFRIRDDTRRRQLRVAEGSTHGEPAGSGVPPPDTRGTRVAVQATRGFHDPARACHARCFIRPVGFVVVTQVNRGERFTLVLFGF